MSLATGKFEMTPYEINKAKEFLEKHRQTCQYFGPRTAGWFGTPIAFQFRTHGLGTEVSIVCNCGTREHLGDPDEID